ncbi:MAG: EamA family transporter [Clostridia bacterium]|nr:EamA family transporter [Clostridia bacterium]
MKDKLPMITSMVIFGTIGIFVELMALPSGIIACARGLTGALIICGVMALKGHKPDFSNIRSKLILLLVSGAAIGFNWILLFEAYRHTGIPVATVCYYTAPIIVTVLSPLVLKENLGVKQIVCVFLALCGIVAVSGVLQGGASKLTGVLCGLGAATLYASVILMNKFMGAVPAYEKTAIQLGAASVTVLPYALITAGEISFNIKSVALLLVVGVVHTGFAYMLYFESIKKLKSQTVAVLSYIDPAAAIILSALIFLQLPTGYELVGVVLILGAAFLSEIKISAKIKRR